MKRVSPHSSAAFVLFFALGVLCSAAASPAQALAGVGPCSEDRAATEMGGCQHAGALCGLDSSANVPARTGLGSSRLGDSPKDVLSAALGDAPPGGSDLGLQALGGRPGVFPVRPKSSIRLFHSVLNL
jgi:hypothetical protein